MNKRNVSILSVLVLVLVGINSAIAAGGIKVGRLVFDDGTSLTTTNNLGGGDSTPPLTNTSTKVFTNEVRFEAGVNADIIKNQAGTVYDGLQGFIYDPSPDKVFDLNTRAWYRDGGTVIAIDAEQSRLNDNAGGVVYSWTNGIFYDAGGGIKSADVFTRSLFDLGGSGNLSLDWQNRKAYDTDGTTAVIDWDSMYLQDGGGVAVVEWGNHKLYSPTASQYSMDWNAYELFDETGNVAIDYGAQLLNKSDGTLVADWGNQALIHGGNTVVDWNGQILKAADASNSVKWNDRQLLAAGDSMTLDYGSAQAWASGVMSYDWNVRTLNDNAGTNSANWAARTLNSAPAGGVVADWSNAVTVAATSPTASKGFYFDVDANPGTAASAATGAWRFTFDGSSNLVVQCCTGASVFVTVQTYLNPIHN